MPAYQTVVFTTEFAQSLLLFSHADQRRIFRALEQLDTDETIRSLNVHQLKGQQAGSWTAYASRNLRIIFRRLDGGRKELLEASQHYGD
jgi:mRNA-degrading endonuclease YafQ of YafQ-DinJ toxin-antitoxin module